MEISDIESRIDAKKVVLHKPRNHGFVAIGEELIYVARERAGTFEFEEIQREAVRTILAKTAEEYDVPEHYGGEDVEKVSDDDRTYTELKITIPSKTVAVTVEEQPREVARLLLDADV